MPFNNQAWQDGRLARANLTLQTVMITLPSLVPVIIICGFISFSTRAATIKVGRMVNQHVLTLDCRV